MNSSFLNNPWLVEVLGGIIAGLVGGLLLNWLSAKLAKAGGTSLSIARMVQSLGYILLAPAFVIAFVFAVPLFALLYLTESSNFCRFTPTCKEYLIEAIEIHGLVPGVMLGIQRLMRCRPSYPCGHDPVPPRRSLRT